ncbi:MAG: phosphatase domain-containing protein, partial [Jiangellales bacterium]
MIDATVQVLRHPRKSLGKLVRSAEAAQVVSDLDRRLSHYRRDRKLGAGSFRGMLVAVHRGYVVGDEVRVHLQVLEQPAIPEISQGMPYRDVAEQNLRRYAALGLPQVDVRITVGDVEVEVTTQRRGYAAATLTVPGLAPGWHRVEATLLPDGAAAEVVTGRGRVLVPHPDAPFAVISDIDDTVLRSRVTEGLRAVLATLVGDANRRDAIPGMASFYRGINRGPGPAKGGGVAALPSFFYVSTGSWAMYPLLTKFLQGRGFPRGPLFLTDWGPTDRYIVRSGREHKRNAIGRLLSGYPQTKFLLIGDSGQADPEIYLEFAGSHPTQIAGILIIDVGPHLADRAEELVALAVEAQTNGVEFHFVRDAF